MPDTIRLDSAAQLNPDGHPHPFFPLRLEVVSHRVGAGQQLLMLDSITTFRWPPDWQGYYVLTAWRFAIPDSLTLIFHANMSTSWEYRLRAFGSANDDSLVGRAVMYSDYWPDTLTQIPLVGHRTVCDRAAPHVTPTRMAP
jgi:hypothetical protein